MLILEELCELNLKAYIRTFEHLDVIESDYCFRFSAMLSGLLTGHSNKIILRKNIMDIYGLYTYNVQECLIKYLYVHPNRRMQLTVRDVAKLLSVNEKTIYRWLKKGSLPGYRVNNHYRFNRAELLEWATSHQINISVDVFQEPNNSQVPLYALSEALSLGGIYYRVEGESKESALSNVVRLMKLPPEVDREFLLQVLLAREALASTAIGDGIAIPHVRNPIVLHVTDPIVCLSFLEKPVDFNSLDGKSVYCLFTLVSPTVKAHLHLLSRLAYILRDRNFRQVLEGQGSREEILSEIVRIESNIPRSQSELGRGEES